MGTETEGFAEALRGLKERSGLSYGALAKRAHMSTSTLHRYCNGDAVPTEFAPVERLARLCGASRDEMVALHRRWIVADDARLRGRSASVPPDEPPADQETVVVEDTSVGAGAEGASAEVGGEGDSAEVGEEPDAPEVVAVAARQRPRRRIRLAVAAAVLVAATASTALAVTIGSETPRSDRTAPDPTGRTGPARATGPAAGPSAAPSAAAPSRSAPPGASPSGAVPPKAAPSEEAPPKSGAPGRRDGRPPLAVEVRPYVWADPCSQVYVVDRPPAQVPPPPSEQAARGWVTALGGVPGGDMLLELVVQGTGEETVVLNALHVREVDRGEPLPWNAYGMGVGCGGNVTPQSLDINLDAARPRAVPVAGQQGDREIPAVGLPYTVSASDPEVLRVTAHTAGYSVRWFLELEWSSGDRSGTLRIDDNGKPFATSAITGRPTFDHPLGSSGWGPRVPNEG
ncbi:helix-turn-helix domain-containing protein [Streptomyces ficellus]|uniref:helix-turn-helix domain-containing protein n=1 Tax=Streptomyces ficellus TaxID=1977088 RepID=UPI001FCC1E32|nr:helix-turn-helix transcriptional regulator [Streptomyces ficellus]